ncbi:Lon protease family protein, partial [Planctomycetota bacterium]
DVLQDVIGQDRALHALEFGLGCASRGYNIYVAGITGTGRTTTVKSVASKMAKALPTPSDWCYVHNFKDPDCPRAIDLTPGLARAFEKDMDDLVETLHKEIPKAFADEEMERQRSEATEDLRLKRAELFTELEGKAKEDGFQLQRSPGGILTVPLKDGEPMSEEEYGELSADEKKEYEKNQEGLNEHIREIVTRVRDLDKEARERIGDIDRRIALYAVGHVIDELREKHRANQKVIEHLIAVQEDILSNIDEFKKEEGSTKASLPGMKGPVPELPSVKYLVNVVIDNSDLEGGPVEEEINPTYSNLVGRVDRKSMYGTLYTDFTMIRPGAILKANGGCLVLHVLDILSKPFAYEAVKNVIKMGELKIEDIGQMYGIFPPQGIKPEPIPVNMKIILIGNLYMYHLLYRFDEDFRKIFKVKAEFARHLEKQDDSVAQYARFARKVCEEEDLPPLNAAAAAELVRYGSRLVSNTEKLSLRFGDIADLIREAAHWAMQAKKKTITADHVQKAVDEKRFRGSLPEEVIHELLHEGTIMVDIDGTKTGQINGLAVHDLGDFAFGRPSRITAQTAAGRAGFIDIERKAELGGKIHRKGMLIVSGFLHGRYGKRRPLSLMATICFEQSYDGVDGDSASTAEIVALVSSIAELPVRQDLAVTGSVNQKGEIQPIGGANEKVEGFFDICAKKGLTGSQGVVLPKKNVRHLVLKKEVIDAVERGDFHIYPIETVDEALEIFLGIPAGEPNEDGTYPEDTVNGLVMKRLEDLAEEMRRFAKGEDDSDEDGEDEGA